MIADAIFEFNDKPIQCRLPIFTRSGCNNRRFTQFYLQTRAVQYRAHVLIDGDQPDMLAM
ncbi:hypothetical protein EV681_2981 [Advenella incenata]|jgi:hypothetical protein|uniref:Uncharacterized protein n=1 Tax=Advenella incenata TaxID=267800 RepID=A0A4Q7VET0_9BURK|nr:hypothetical protein EV681_2981 [Advenella incenata]